MFKKFLKLEEILKENNKKENENQQSENQQKNAEQQESDEQQQGSNEEQNPESQGNSEQQRNGEPQQSENQQKNAEQQKSGEQQQESNEEQSSEPQENSEQEQTSNEQEESRQEESSEQQRNGEPQQNENQQKNAEQQKNGEQQENAEQQNQSSNEEQDEDTAKTEGKNKQEDNKKEEEVEKKKHEAEEMFDDISKKSNPDHYNDIGNELEDLDYDEIPDSVINVLINKFFNQQFRTKEDLNKKQDAYQEDVGDLNWNITDIIKHKVTKDLNKIRYDKYGFKKESGKGESIPLSFYFDLSGSMEEYIRILSIMAYKMLEKGVKVIVGFNQNAYVQIEKIPNNYTIDKFEQLMSNLEYKIKGHEIEKIEEKVENNPMVRNLYNDYKNIIEKQKQKVESIKIDDGVEIRKLNGIEIDQYLIERRAEKTVVFSDFDPKKNVENLSEKCKTWWFCFREVWEKGALKKYKGKFYRTTSITDIVKHFKNIDRASYELKQRRIGEYGTEECYEARGATKNKQDNTYAEEYEEEEWYEDLYEER